jgi:hypothetical protein
MSAIIPLTREKKTGRTLAAGHRRVAAIDIGSNSIRQIVADVSADGTIQVVDEMKAAPRLAAGLSATGQLSDTSIHAAIEAIERMATLARQLGAERVDCVATSAVREASNASTLLAEIQRRTGLRARVLDGGMNAWRKAGLPVREGRKRLPVDRQVQLIAGSMVLAGVALGVLVSPWFLGLAAFFGAGLPFAGATGTCGLALVLMKLPWNRPSAATEGVAAVCAAGGVAPATCATPTCAAPADPKR